jgi:CheY-like chemotaxis protein
VHPVRFRLWHLEDDDSDALLVQQALRRSHRPVDLTRYHDPTAAIAVLESIYAPEVQAPHLILTDLKMPKMDGLEFVKWLRQSRFACIPVIMLTGSTLPTDVLAAYRSGVNSFSTKPVSVLHLNELVSTVLKYWNELCATPTAVADSGFPICNENHHNHH